MPLSHALLAELQHESLSTKKVLERVPTERFSWKPHEKSATLGDLATHLSELPQWVSRIVNEDGFDLLANNMQPSKLTDSAALMRSFEDHIAEAKAVLAADVTDEKLMTKWTMKRGDQVFFDLPKIVALRSMAFNHIVHHRAQLGVYLRLLDIPVPSVYGPTADEKFF